MFVGRHVAGLGYWESSRLTVNNLHTGEVEAALAWPFKWRWPRCLSPRWFLKGESVTARYGWFRIRIKIGDVELR